MSLKNINTATITGNTYACREEIKRLGGVFDKEQKAWVINIARHPSNTMRGRSGLGLSLRKLEEQGCRITYS